jgi:hypothetical protein
MPSRPFTDMSVAVTRAISFSWPSVIANTSACAKVRVLRIQMPFAAAHLVQPTVRMLALQLRKSLGEQLSKELQVY